MSVNEEEKNDSTFDSEDGDETIALSNDELNDILSEAEIVQETSSKKETTGVSKAQELTDREADNPEISEEEFDISGEIDELTPEDLENIELEESEIETFSKELEEEIGEEIEIPEVPPEEEIVSEEELSEELGGIDTEEISIEAETDEEVDLDGYLDKETEGIDLDSIDLGEEIQEEELTEPPVLGEEGEEISVEAGEAFKEAGIEGVAEETVTLEEADLEGIDDISLEDISLGEEGIPSEGEEAGEVTLEEIEDGVIVMDDSGEAEASVSKTEEEEITEAEAPLSEAEEFSLPPEGLGEEVEETFSGEIQLEEDEEKILSEDFDLTAGTEGEVESEEVVTVSGEELAELGEGEIEVEKAVPAGDGASPIDAALLNDVTTILKFMDNLLGDLPDDKIKEFAKSEYFPLYKEVFDKLKLN
jgi:hypothetical protein